MKKKLLALAVILVMLISLLPVTSFATATRYRMFLMDGTPYELAIWASNEGETTYTKNKEVTLTDSASNPFTGYVQEIVTVTNEATDEWNTKFYYDEEKDQCVLVLKGAKLDAYNNETQLTVAKASAICGLATSEVYSFRIEVAADSTIEAFKGIYSNGSKTPEGESESNIKWEDIEIVSQGNAKLTAISTGPFFHIQGNFIKINANIDYTGIDNADADRDDLLYLNKKNGIIEINGGTVNVNCFRLARNVNANVIKINGGNFNGTFSQYITNITSVEFKEGMCYIATDNAGNSLDLPNGDTSKKSLVIETYESHTPANADDTCFTADACAVCGGEALAAQTVHIAGANADDCTKDTICGNPGCTQVFAPKLGDAHIAGANVADCTKPAMCTNEGCTKEAAPASRTQHEADQDDGDCTTGIKCKHCEVIVTPGAEKHTVTNRTDCSVAYNCEVCGKQALAAGEHTPAADDGDCTTAIKCTVCGKDTTAAQDAHKYTDKNDTTCDNAGCTNTRKVEGDENPKTGDNSAIAVVAALMVTAAAAFVTTKKFAR